jgi:hypothetical protein
MLTKSDTNTELCQQDSTPPESLTAKQLELGHL